MILEALKKSQLGQHLTADEAFDTFREIMNGEVTDPVLIGALLTAMQIVTARKYWLGFDTCQ